MILRYLIVPFTFSGLTMDTAEKLLGRINKMYPGAVDACRFLKSKLWIKTCIIYICDSDELIRRTAVSSSVFSSL